MKKLLLLLLCVPLLVFSQNSDRVLEIKKMRKECKLFGNEKDCKRISTEEIEHESGKSFKQYVQKCLYPEGYSKIDFALGNNLEAEYFYKDGKLYFAYIINDLGSSMKKFKLYFKSDGDIEKLSVSDYEKGNIRKSEIKDKNEIERIKQSELRWLEIAKKELNK